MCRPNFPLTQRANTLWRRELSPHKSFTRFIDFTWQICAFFSSLSGPREQHKMLFKRIMKGPHVLATLCPLCVVFPFSSLLFVHTTMLHSHLGHRVRGSHSHSVAHLWIWHSFLPSRSISSFGLCPMEWGPFVICPLCAFEPGDFRLCPLNNCRISAIFLKFLLF